MAITRVGEAAVNGGSGTGTAITTTLPAGIASGDLLILEVATGVGPYTLTNNGAGWTQLLRVADAGTAPAEAAVEVWWKAAGVSESAPTLTAATATRWQTVVRAFRGVDTASPFLATGSASESGGSTTTVHSAPALTNTDAGAWGVFALSARQVPTPHTATPSAGLTQRVDQDTGNTSTVNLLLFAADSNGAVGTGSVTYSAAGSSGSAIAAVWAGLLRPTSGATSVAGATGYVNVTAASGSAVGGSGLPTSVAGATAMVVVQGGARPVPPPPSTTSVAFPPDPYRQAIRSGGTAVAYTVDATLGGVPVAGASGLRPVGGTITDTTKPGVRRVLNLDLAPEPGLYDLLRPEGTMLNVTCHVTYTNRSVQDIPMGLFDIDSEKISEGSGGGISLTAPDKWVKIQRARFIRPTSSVPGVLVVDQIALLIQGALGPNETVAVSSTSTARVGALTWEKDRDKAIIDLASSIGAWVFFDREGLATIADVPTSGASADWLLDASPSGVLIELDRERSRTSTRNVIVVESSSTEEGGAFPTVVVWDDEVASPTYAGPDPINSPELAGPFGIAVGYYDTPLPLDADAARRTGLTILARSTGLASQVSLGQIPNPAMDAFAVIDVLPNKQRYDIPRQLERHVADTVTHPLTVGGSPQQQIEGRSTRTDEIVGGS